MSTRLPLAVNNTLRTPEPFPFNPEALAALKDAYESWKALPIEDISCTAVGSPGSTERLRRVTALLTEAATLIREVARNPVEIERYQHWTDVYDNPLRPEEPLPE